MSFDPRQIPSIFRIDVSADAAAPAKENIDPTELVVALLRQLVSQQDRQVKLLEEINGHLGAPQRQRQQELTQWKEANPDLARHCRVAAETLSRVQTQFLQTLTEEVRDNEECLVDGEFMLNEFVDRFGPRLAHLNGVLQVLAQLSSSNSSSTASGTH